MTQPASNIDLDEEQDQLGEVERKEVGSTSEATALAAKERNRR